MKFDYKTKEWDEMNKFFITLFIAIIGFSFSNKTFAKTIIKNKNNIVDVVFILPLLI